MLDIFSGEIVDNPYPIYAKLRANAPVLRADPYGFWLVSRYEDVIFVLRNPDLFSSVDITRGSKVMRSSEEDRLWREPMVNTQALITSNDPPIHTRLRKLITGAFAPRAIARLEERIRRTAEGFIDQLIRRNEVDIIADFAVPLPIIVIAEMLGVDPDRRADFKRWSDDAISVQTGVTGRSTSEIDRILHSRREFVSYFKGVIEDRRKAPRDDLISEFCRTEVESDTLTSEEVLAMTLVLLVGGNETTTNLVGNGTLALADSPELQERLRREPALIPEFIEEVLRYDGPAKMVSRRATRDVTVAGVEIPRDAVVIALLSSANRDPAQFPEPDRFDITRDNRSHVAFGHGIHFCVGAYLSRLEGRIAFETMLRRLPRFSRKQQPLAWHPSYTMRGLRELPLEFETSGAAAR